jgi:hypothetical protein
MVVALHLVRGIVNSPAAVVAVGTIVVIAFVLALTLTIGGNYLLTVHYVNAENARQMRALVPLCKALRDLDLTSVGAHWPKGNTYAPKMVQAIHNVYLNTHCPSVLK